MKGITPKIRMLCFVLINSVLGNLSRVWISFSSQLPKAVCCFFFLPFYFFTCCFTSTETVRTIRDQGPYAWVQGRRATSKVTATSGGRLTNRYAWVTGRPTRRACLGVKFPLRVPPCKHYPEEVTELKMAALILLRHRQRRLLRRNRIFWGQDKPFRRPPRLSHTAPMLSVIKSAATKEKKGQSSGAV